MNMNEYRLSIKLDRYAGNVDEFVSCALTGSGNERYDDNGGEELFKQKVEPLLVTEDTDYIDEYPELPVPLCNFPTEYGMSAYSLDYRNNNTNSLLIGLAGTYGLKETVAIWKKAFPVINNQIHLNGKKYTVKILNFTLVTIRQDRVGLDY